MLNTKYVLQPICMDACSMCTEDEEPSPMACILCDECKKHGYKMPDFDNDQQQDQVGFLNHLLKKDIQ